TPLGKFDLVFSNAALQWMPEQERVVPGWFELLSPGGVLAVQLPNNFASPLHQAMLAMAQSEKWRSRIAEVRQIQYFSAGYYYDILAKLPGEFEIWTTTYQHVLDSHEDIVEWYKGTGFRPYLNQLDEQGQAGFLDDMLSEVRRLYPPRFDGKILFEFERLFFVVKRV
ncbi:MAG: methyltransferase domain-containing protein, partial [Oscillospiraceae bacterium]|nr:methyltransferase domain-containing protein [Oscillospiraceae bacterium]